MERQNERYLASIDSVQPVGWGPSENYRFNICSSHTLVYGSSGNGSTNLNETFEEKKQCGYSMAKAICVKSICMALPVTACHALPAFSHVFHCSPVIGAGLSDLVSIYPSSAGD